MSEEEPAYRERLEAAKRASTAQLLFKAARLLNDEALSRVRARSGERRLRASHTTLLPHIDLEGTRLTVLADKLGVTKQAAGQLVEELEQMGVLERVDDPTDGRAKLIRFSKAGRRGLLDGLGVLRELEQELAQRVGRTRMRALHDALGQIIDLLERAAPLDRDRSLP